MRLDVRVQLDARVRLDPRSRRDRRVFVWPLVGMATRLQRQQGNNIAHYAPFDPLLRLVQREWGLWHRAASCCGRIRRTITGRTPLGKTCVLYACSARNVMWSWEADDQKIIMLKSRNINEKKSANHTLRECPMTSVQQLSHNYSV